MARGARTVGSSDRCSRRRYGRVGGFVFVFVFVSSIRRGTRRGNRGGAAGAVVSPVAVGRDGSRRGSAIDRCGRGPPGGFMAPALRP